MCEGISVQSTHVTKSWADSLRSLQKTTGSHRGKTSFIKDLHDWPARAGSTEVAIPSPLSLPPGTTGVKCWPFPNLLHDVESIAEEVW